MSQTKVIATTNQNKITLKDIRTRKRFWEHPWIYEDRIDERGGTINKGKKRENPDYRDLVIYTGWKWWQSDYKFLPTPDKFVKIKKDFLENTWGTLDKQEHFILRNKNNSLTIFFQNKKQLDFIRPDTVIFFGRNTADKEGRARQERAGRKGIEYPNLYWIKDWDYTNNKTLYCQLTCEKDPIWANYGDMMNSKGIANITSSQINNDHLNKEGKIIASAAEHWPNDEDWKDASGDENTGDHNCPACDNCYDFCGDLRNKRSCSIGYSTQGRVAQWQPDFKLLYTVFPKDLFNTGVRNVAAEAIVDEQGNQICVVPSNLILQEWHPGIKTGDIMGDAKIPSLLFIVDKKHKGNSPTADPRREPTDKTKYIWEELPKCYHEQPHLCNHSAAQFYFQKKLLFTANLKIYG